MRVAAIELFVNVAHSNGGDDGSAIRAAIQGDPSRREKLVLAALEKAVEEKPDVILCPGWTFVGRHPAPQLLRKSAGQATVIFEVFPRKNRMALGAPAKGKDATEGNIDGRVDWATYVLEGGRIRAIPRQVFIFSSDLNEITGAQFTRALLKRRIGHGIVLVCGEVNVVRRRKEQDRIRHYWDPRAETARTELKDLVVFNPAHAPNSSYVRTKRRKGPWRALVSTSNRLDRRTLSKRSNLPAPAHAVVKGHDRMPSNVAKLDGDESRVLFYDLPDELGPGKD